MSLISYAVRWMFNDAINLSLQSYVCNNSVCKRSQYTKHIGTNKENKTISYFQNVTWKYWWEKFRFLGQLNGRYYHKSWYFRPKNDLGLIAETYDNCTHPQEDSNWKFISPINFLLSWTASINFEPWSCVILLLVTANIFSLCHEGYNSELGAKLLHLLWSLLGMTLLIKNVFIECSASTKTDLKSHTEKRMKKSQFSWWNHGHTTLLLMELAW